MFKLDEVTVVRFLGKIIYRIIPQRSRIRLAAIFVGKDSIAFNALHYRVMPSDMKASVNEYVIATLVPFTGSEVHKEQMIVTVYF